MAEDTKADAVKKFERPDIENFGPGEVALFDFVWTDYLWSDLKAGKSWIVRLKNADVAVIAVLKGDVDVRSEDGSFVRNVTAGHLFAAQNRIIEAKSDSTLFAAPLFQVLPMAARRDDVDADGGRGGPAFV